MTAATTATRTIPLDRPAAVQPAPILGRLVEFLRIAREAWVEARIAEREAARRYPFVDW